MCLNGREVFAGKYCLSNHLKPGIITALSVTQWFSFAYCLGNHMDFLNFFPLNCYKFKCTCFLLLFFSGCPTWGLEQDFDWLPDAHQAAFSLPLLKRTGGENQMKKLVRWDTDREIVHRLLSWAKEAWLREINLLYCQLKIESRSEKQRQN